MTIVQIPNAGGTAGRQNIGIPILDLIRDQFLGFILLDPGVHFTSADLADYPTFLAACKTKARALRGSAIYPFWKCSNFDDKSKDPTKASAGNLTNTEITTGDGIPSFDLQHRQGEIFHSLLQAFESFGGTVCIIDKKYALYGTDDGSGNVTGYSMSEFYCGIAKFGTTSAASYYPFTITLASQTEYKENARFVQCDKRIVGVSGKRNVVLDATVAGSVVSLGLTGDGGKNLTDNYATELAQIGAYIVKKVVGGTTATVSAAFNSSTKRMDLTLSGTPWTGASTGDLFTVDLVSAAALAALSLPIDGWESTGPVTIAKP